MNLTLLKDTARTYFRGIGQVMFQESAWTGLLFLAGIFWGSYECHMPQVAWGAVVGAAASVLGGYIMGEKPSDGAAGLWGFNGVLVGCAFPTFLANTWLMWACLVFCSLFSTWVRRAFNNVMAPWKVNSLTFPFVFTTWIFLLAAGILHGLDGSGLSKPIMAEDFSYTLDTGLGHLVVYWLKGIAQVFLVDSWVTGVFFVVALAVCSRWAAAWAMIASAISLALAILFEADPSNISSGLFGFSPVLTGIAFGCTFFRPNWKSALWAIAAVIATFFIQAAMDVMFKNWGIPTLTGPFCVATWLFLLPLYRFDNKSISLKTAWRDYKESMGDDDMGGPQASL